MKVAAIYARVSSDRQKEEGTIASQIAALREFSNKGGYSIPEEWLFQDEGYSGAVLVRPGLERLRDLASEGQIEAVLIYSPDRLSRKYAYQVLLTEEFARHGVDVHFIKSPKATTPEEHLLLQFQGMIAEYERAQIAERTRRGKRHRAKAGLINVLSGAPYGYRYVKKTETCAAYYEVIEEEAEVVRKVYKLYTEEGLSINAIVRWLNDQCIPTRKGISPWERTTVWAMLRNPAYKGTACFGKTERTERKKITRPLRQRGGFSPRCTANRERPREDWIEIPVPPIISEEIFAMAQERLEQNKRFSPRRTIEPTLLQGMLVCSVCGYAFYRTSTRTSKRQLYYYRCLGSDNWRYPNGRLCYNRPIRQDYLDSLVWKQVIELLENPELIRAEIQRRIQNIQDSNPTKRRKEALSKELTRVQKGIEKLVDAYQEGLVQLVQLRKRVPELRKREEVLKSELHNLEVAAVDQQAFLRLADNIEGFLERLRTTADTLSVTERQKILRLVVKEILLDHETIKIKHSIPVTESNTPSGSSGNSEMAGYLLRSWSHHPALGSSGGLVAYLSLLHYSGLQPAPDQAKHPSVLDYLPDQLHQDFMVQVVIETPNVQIHHFPESLLTQLFHPLRRRMGTPTHAEPMALFVKVLIEDRTKDIMDRLLTHSVIYHRYAQRPLLLAPQLVDVTSQSRFASVRVVDEPLPQDSEVFLLLCLPLLHAHPVHASSALVPHHLAGRSHKVLPIVYLVDRAMENPLHLTPSLCQNGLWLPAVPLSGSGPFSLGTYPCPRQSPLPSFHGVALCHGLTPPRLL